jgi:preprotein translocase subunit SecG
MLYGLLSTLFVLLCFLIILIILLQKSKGSLGVIGSAGSGAQLLFGGSGGQDLFQKITWGFVFLFLGGSLLLAILKNASVNQSKYANIAAPATEKIPAEQPAANAQ